MQLPGLAALLALAALSLTGGPGHARESPAPPDMRGVAEQAAIELKARHYDAAAAAYQRIIDRYPDSLFAWDNLGMVRYDQGETNAAIGAFKHAIHLDPKDDLAQMSLGVCLYEKREYSAAIPPFERAEKLRADNSNVHAFLAQCYAKVGREDDAHREMQIENVQQLDTYR
jgi:predicted Zn-dependent protease